MSAEFPFQMPSRDWSRRNAELVEDRLSLINDMDRATLNAALAVPNLQPKVASALRRRLKQFDEWGYDVVVEFYDFSTRKFTIPGNARAVRRKAMLKSCAKRVVEISEPITREAWVRAYGDGKTRM